MPRLAPADGKSRHELESEQLDPAVLELAKAALQPEGGARLQFTLGQLMILMVFAGLGLAGARLLPRGTFAGIAGLLALTGLVISQLMTTRHRLFDFAWFSLIVMYLLAAMSSVILPETE